MLVKKFLVTIKKLAKKSSIDNRHELTLFRKAPRSGKALLLATAMGLVAGACSSSGSTNSLPASERAVSMAWVSSGAVFVVAGGVTQPTQVNFPTSAVPVPSGVQVSASGHYVTFITPRPSGPGNVTWVYNTTDAHLQQVKCGALNCGVPGFAGDVFMGEILRPNGLASHLVLLPPGDPTPIKIPLTGYPKQISGEAQEFLAPSAKTKANVLGVAQVGAVESVPLKNASGAMTGQYALFLLKTEGTVKSFGVVSEKPQYDVSQINTSLVAILLGTGSAQKVEIVNVNTGKVTATAGNLGGLKIQTIFSANGNWYVVGRPGFSCSICSGTKTGHEVLLELNKNKWTFLKSATIADGPFNVNFSGTSGNALIKSGKLETVAPLTDIAFSS